MIPSHILGSAPQLTVSGPNQNAPLSTTSAPSVSQFRRVCSAFFAEAQIIRLERMLNAADQRLGALVGYIRYKVSGSADAGQRLIAAAKNNNIEVARTAISQIPDMECVDLTGKTALMHAVIKRNVDMVKALLAAGAYVNMVDNEGHTALMLAFRENNVEIAELLLGVNASVNVDENSCSTALLFAAAHGNDMFVKLLLEEGGNVGRRDEKSRTPLALAAQNGHDKTVELLLANGADVEAKDREGMTPLLFAAKAGHLSVVNLLLAKRADVKAKVTGWTPLLFAAEAGHPSVVELLLANGAALEEKAPDGMTPLLFAAKNGHAGVVKLLLAKGASVEEKDPFGMTPLLLAAQKRHTSVVELLIANGADVEAKDPDGRTLLLLAAEEGDTSLVELLLKAGADVEAKGPFGMTPLLFAAKKGHTSIVELLLAKGADVEAKDEKGRRTPLLFAAEKGNAGAVELLLEKGANVEARRFDAMTPLMLAAMGGHTRVAEQLLAKNANPNREGRGGAFALSIAAEHRRYATVTSLIQGIKDPQETLRAVLEFDNLDMKKTIIRAWLNSTTNKLDAVTAICCVFASGPELWSRERFYKPDALRALASSGLTLTEEDVKRLEKSVALSIGATEFIRDIFVSRLMQPEYALGNAYWSGNHDLVDELIDEALTNSSNAHGVKSPENMEGFYLKHITSGEGDYLHAVGKLHDQSPEVNWGCDMDPMAEAGWRTAVTTPLRRALNEATEASRQISKLLADPEKGFTLIDEAGYLIAADNIRLKDTLFAFELERNEPLNQIAEPPESPAAAASMRNHQQARMAQAKALLASNKDYIRLKLDMPALAKAKDVEKRVRSRLLSAADAVVKLEKLLSETEHTFFEAPGMETELARHWFWSEVKEICETLKEMRDNFHRLNSPPYIADAKIH